MVAPLPALRDTTQQVSLEKAKLSYVSKAEGVASCGGVHWWVMAEVQVAVAPPPPSPASKDESISDATTILIRNSLKCHTVGPLPPMIRSLGFSYVFCFLMLVEIVDSYIQSHGLPKF